MKKCNVTFRVSNVHQTYTDRDSVLCHLKPRENSSSQLWVKESSLKKAIIKDRPIGSGVKTGPSEAGHLRHFSFSPPPLNNLLKFVVKGCENQYRWNEDRTHIYSMRLQESIKNAISFDVLQLQIFLIFMERLPSVVILCFSQFADFQGLSSGVVMHEKFPHIYSLRSPLFSSPLYDFRSDGPVDMQGSLNNLHVF